MDAKIIVNSCILFRALIAIDAALSHFEDSNKDISIYRETISSLKKELRHTHTGDNIKITMESINEEGE